MRPRPDEPTAPHPRVVPDICPLPATTGYARPGDQWPGYPPTSLHPPVLGPAPLPRPTAMFPRPALATGHLYQPYPGYPGPPIQPRRWAPATAPPAAIAPPRPPRRRGVAVLWSLVALLAVATVVAAVVLSNKAADRAAPTPIPTPTAPSTTKSTGPTAPRPFPAYTAGGAPGTPSSTDPNDLIAAVTPFIDGVNDHDLSAVLAASCTGLAGQVRQADLDPISDMRVTGPPTVTAGVGRVPISYADETDGAQDSELLLVKERGEWKVCSV